MERYAKASEGVWSAQPKRDIRVSVTRNSKCLSPPICGITKIACVVRRHLDSVTADHSALVTFVPHCVARMLGQGSGEDAFVDKVSRIYVVWMRLKALAGMDRCEMDLISCRRGLQLAGLPG